MASFLPLAGRSGYDVNFENAQRARAKRMQYDAEHPGQMRTVLPDPAWDAFYGGLDRAQETAAEAGMGFRVNLGGFGRPGYAEEDGRLPLNPFDRESLKNLALQGAGNAAVGQAKAEMFGQQAFNDARQQQLVDDLQRSYDQNRLDAAYAPPEEPTAISASPDGSKVTMRPAAPLSERERILRSVPGHIRPELEQMYSKIDMAQNEQDLKKRQMAVDEGRLDETKRHNQATENASVGDVQDAVQGMMDGSIPPQLPSRATKEYTQLLAEAKRRGYNLAQAATDWTATQKHIASMNGAQQLRLNQSVNALPEMLDTVEGLAKQWKAGPFPLLTRANLALAKNGAFGQDAAAIANKLDAQIADVTADLGNVYMGGNSPTDHALELAGKSLKGEWSERVLLEMIDLARQNVRIRKNSISNTGVMGASANNPYAVPAPGQGGTVKLQAPDGSIADVPADQADHYLKLGAKRVGG